ncbi:MAG: ankyrin repeat domain-containing protein [Gemmatimonadota bacterium]|nr:ankyrin repeat domain-containing protein [Gemmatimonadota bacterium]
MASEPLAEFIKFACVPRDAWHQSGTLERAESIRAAHPDVATADIRAAAILGDDATVRRFIEADRTSATSKGGPYGWDALTHLCFSRYLRLDRTRSDGIVRAAEALLDAGASPNTGFHEGEHQPKPEFESALYGAAGVAHHPEMTRLLLDRGADPNDGETEYHSPEGFDNRAMEMIVESGKLAKAGLTTMLARKIDWTDYDGAVWLLEHGADPNDVSHWGRRSLQHAIGRDSALRFFMLLLDHGADPRLPAKDGTSTYAITAAAGRGDVLTLFEQRGFPVILDGDAAWLGAIAAGDEARAQRMVVRDPPLITRVRSQRPDLLVTFAGAGNAAGTRILLNFGFDIAAPTKGGDTALHAAAWRERRATVEALLSRGAPRDARNHRGETPLDVARRALVEYSEFTPHSSPAIVELLSR